MKEEEGPGHGGRGEGGGERRRGGNVGVWDPKQPLHALNFLLGLLHLNSLEQAVSIIEGIL